ncbi:hypothetical protein ACQPWW_03610 [Micromonospora sp. CA-240977]|uniref:hypothetical protein n=1 Tax=Micromonospora sp. CA-240977 TaxID=3239957 RepID=UPI003D8F9D24
MMACRMTALGRPSGRRPGVLGAIQLGRRVEPQQVVEPQPAVRALLQQAQIDQFVEGVLGRRQRLLRQHRRQTGAGDVPGTSASRRNSRRPASDNCW